MIALAFLATLLATPANLAAQIRAAKAGDRVTLTGNVGEVLVANRTGLTIDARKAVASFRVQGSQRITIYAGTLVAGANGRAASIDSSSDVQFLGGTIDGAADGIVVARSDGVLVQDFVAKGIVGNGVTIAGSTRVTINRVTCRDWRPDPTGTIHPDCVQAWSLPGRITADVLVTGVQADGPIQGVWFGAEPGGFDRVRVIGNTVRTSNAPNGIGLRNCRACVVTDNHVSTLQPSRWPTTIALIPMGDAVMMRNVVEAK